MTDHLRRMDEQEQRNVRAALDRQQRDQQVLCVVCQDKGCEFCPRVGLIEFVTPDDEFGRGLGEVDGES